MHEDLLYSQEAEEAFLGSLMLNNQAWELVDYITREDFYFNEHKYIFESINCMLRKNQAFDILVIIDDLKAKDLLADVGGEVKLFTIANNTVKTANITSYADIIKNKSIIRQLLDVSNGISQECYLTKGRSAKDLLDKAERLIFGIRQKEHIKHGAKHISQVLDKVCDEIDKRYQSGQPIAGQPTGYVDLDVLTSGLMPGDLIIVAGRPSMGKTAFAMNIAENMLIADNKPILVFSLEMPAEAIATRMLSSIAKVSQTKLRTGQLDNSFFTKGLPQAIELLMDKPLYIDDTSALSPYEARSRARRIAREHGQLGLVIVDYLQLMSISGYSSDNRVGEISEISRTLKSMAKELQCPVIAISQLNRGVESRQNKKPLMSDLRESGSIEQDADLIMFVYREEVYDKASPRKGIADIIISKHRNGEIGEISLAFLGNYTKFENLHLLRNS